MTFRDDFKIIIRYHSCRKRAEDEDVVDKLAAEFVYEIRQQNKNLLFSLPVSTSL